MGRIRERTRKAMRTAGLPEDAVLGTARVTMLGKGIARNDNHCGLVELTDERIRLRTRDGMITLTGKGLSLRLLTSDTAQVEGEIDGTAQ